MTLGQRIRIARERLQPAVTQAAMGKKLGVTDKAVSGWECDRDTPHPTKLMPIAKFLRVPVSWLLDGGSSKPPLDDIQMMIESLDSPGRLLARTFIETLVTAAKTAKADEQAS